MRIAIVGTGISGLVCAHLLHPHHEIDIYEANGYVGGHANTARVDFPDETHHVDTGFIVYNTANYPGFSALLEGLGVATQPSAMSFSVSDERTGLEYRGTNLNTVFAQRRNLLHPRFLRLLSDVVRFNRSLKHLARSEDQRGTYATMDERRLADLVEQGRYSTDFVERFLVPFGASIWSAAPRTVLDFPAATYARFMDNHGLLDLRGAPRWRTVSGGSARYVEALTAPFRERIHLDTPVEKIVRHRRPAGATEIEVLANPGGPARFDRVILATHSDQALRLLTDASTDERSVLGAIGYQPNTATLHTDERFLPRRPRARASWNYHIADPLRGTRSHAEPDASHGHGGATLTYWMNELQSIRSSRQLLVTLNRHEEIDPAAVLGRFEYDHPVLDLGAVRAQRRRHEIQGRSGVYFTGAYWGYGFHEDGVQSALDVCRRLEVDR